MLIAIERLLLHVRQVPSRADELLELRRRLRAERATRPDADERAAAMAIRELKVRLATATSAVSSCRSCSSGKPWPRGAYAGGDCCSGVTAELFDELEVAALAQAGTRSGDLVAPRGEHPGCAFRGPIGCTLAAEHRPGRCLHYVCDGLRGELHARGELEAIEATLAELEREMARFIAVRAARLDREVVAPLIEGVRAFRIGRPPT